MDKLRLETLAVRVVEWHNRHPLARRITVQHVQSIGYVALPYRAAAAASAVGAGAPAVVPAAGDDLLPGASLRERALARARQPAAAAPAPAKPTPKPPAAPGSALAAVYSEDFLAPVRPARVARWAAQHGCELGADPRDAPVRHIEATDPGGNRTLYALTALIETAGLRTRVLAGPGEQPLVLGRRLWSRPRLAVLGALLLALVGVAALLTVLMDTPAGQSLVPAPPAAVHAASSASAPGAKGPASAASAAASPAMVAPPTAIVASAPAARASMAASAAPIEPPVDVEPQLGKITLPPLKLPHTARPPHPAFPGQAASVPAAKPPPRTASAPVGLPAQAAPVAAEPPAPLAPALTRQAPSAAMAAAARPGQATFAVSTRILRTRAESEQVKVAMQALLDTLSANAARVEIVATGDDWRVVGWPFARREDAERARALLVSRGMRVVVLDL